MVDYVIDVGESFEFEAVFGVFGVLFIKVRLLSPDFFVALFEIVIHIDQHVGNDLLDFALELEPFLSVICDKIMPESTESNLPIDSSIVSNIFILKTKN